MSVWFGIPNENTYLQRTGMLEVDYEKQGKIVLALEKINYTVGVVTTAISEGLESLMSPGV